MEGVGGDGGVEVRQVLAFIELVLVKERERTERKEGESSLLIFKTYDSNWLLNKAC